MVLIKGEIKSLKKKKNFTGKLNYITFLPKKKIKSVAKGGGGGGVNEFYFCYDKDLTILFIVTVLANQNTFVQ